jgi:hypothetical protein
MSQSGVFKTKSLRCESGVMTGGLHPVTLSHQLEFIHHSSGLLEKVFQVEQA